MKHSRIPLLAGGIISLLVLVGLLGGGVSVLARGAHHPLPHHQKKKQPPITTSVAPTIPPLPFCQATGMNALTCHHLDAATTLSLKVTPDCQTLTVTDSAGMALQRTAQGTWVLTSRSDGSLSFSVDGTSCSSGRSTLILREPTGETIEVSASW